MNTLPFRAHARLRAEHNPGARPGLPSLRAARRPGRRRCGALASVAFALAFLGSSRTARAVTCPTDGVAWSADIPVKITVKDHPNFPGTNAYIHNQDYLWYLSVPAVVNNVKVHWSSFSIEDSPQQPPAWDYFAVIGGANYGTVLYYDGNRSGLWEAPWGLPAPAQRYWLIWHTDPSVSVAGGHPFIDKVQVRCNSMAVAQPYAMGLQQEMQGVLFGTGQTTHFFVDVPANRPLFLTLDGHPANADFDLYADTTNQLPGPGAQWSSTSAAASESILTWSFASTTRVYVTVKSYAGEGSFVLHPYAPKYPGVARKVCAQQQVGPALGSAWTKFVNDLKRTSMRMLQATNGSLLVSTWNVHQIPLVYGPDGKPKDWCDEIDSSCEICVNHPLSDSPCADQSNGGVSRMPGFNCASQHDSDWQSVVNVHEQGHSKLGLDDEYNWCGANGINWICPTCGCGAFCGHGLMNGPATHVFCTGSSPSSNRHCVDGLPGVTKNPDISTPCVYYGSSWYQLSNYAPYYDPPPGPNPDASYDLVFNASALSRASVWYYNL